MDILPDKEITLDMMLITKLLAKKATQSLGDFEVQYLYDPVGVRAAEEFCKKLNNLSEDIRNRNDERKWKYDVLDPMGVPNSISV